MKAFTWLSRFAVDYSQHGRRALIRYFTWLIGLIALVIAAYQLLFSGEGTCLTQALQLQLSALDEAPRNQFTQLCSVDTVNQSLGRDLILAAVYLLGLGLFVTVWWAESWDTEPERTRGGGWIFAAMACATLVLAAISAGLTRANIELVSGRYQLGFASIIASISWIRWLLTGLLVAGLIVTLISWLIRGVAHIFRFLFDKDDEAAYQPESVTWPPTQSDPPLFGICLSGGGIRSAAFSLGALSALEETPVDNPRANSSAGLLGQADVLASVSGGGYAASAWRIAVGPEADDRTDHPVLGNPNDYAPTEPSRRFQLTSEPDQPTNLLFPRLQARRKYLSSGRGGLFVTAIWMILALLWHITILVSTVGLLAWPAGRLIRSPIITSADGSIQYGRLATPGLWVLAAAGLVLAYRSTTEQGRRRTMANYSILALSLLGIGLLVLLVFIPWQVREFIPTLAELLPGYSGAKSTIATILSGGIVAAIWRVLQAPLKTYAAYLGGALLGVGLVLLGGLVSLHASSDDRLLSSNWTVWFALVGAFLLVLSVVNPDLWSLHPIYRRRLASTFANRWGSDGWTSMEAKEDHLPLSAYRGAPGPQQLICAVAARMDRSNTGVPVVSMTFEPDHVAVHPGPDRTSVAIDTAAYERLLGGRLRSRWLRSVIGVAAMSAAAVAPSLGRMSMGSTNALIAALNLRLGVWMPNPMFVRGRRAGTHMLNMFKEIFGYFDLADPNLYVTDGGHWENLALVELVRRKAKIIISVDASADPPYSFASLMEAIELALLECNAKIVFGEGEIEAMQPAGSPRSAKNWSVATITYEDDSKGRLLYVKAQASDAMPLDVLRYSKEDASFPNYSTANQFLGEAEFCNLAILGRESMINALDDKRSWLFSDETEQPDDGAEPTDNGETAGGTEDDESEIIQVQAPPPTRKAPSAPSLAGKS